MLKKILSSMLVASMVMSSFCMTAVHAEDESVVTSRMAAEQNLAAEKLAAFLPEFITLHERYSLQADDLLQPTLGAQIPVYGLDEDGVSPAEYSLYPIMNADGHIVALSAISYHNDETAFHFKKGFADELDAAVQQYGNDLALYYGPDMLYAYFPDEGLIELQSIPKAFQLGYEEPANVVNLLEASDYTVRQVEMDVLLEDYLIQPQTIYSKICETPIVGQGDTNFCWAASISSAGQYITLDGPIPNGEIARKVGIHADDKNKGRASMSDVKLALSMAYNLKGTIYAEKITYSTIKRYIDSKINTANPKGGRPILVSVQGENIENEKIGHMIVIDGYYYNNANGNDNKLIHYMDPYGNGDYSSSTLSPSGGFDYIWPGHGMLYQSSYITI